MSRYYKDFYDREEYCEICHGKCHEDKKRHHKHDHRHDHKDDWWKNDEEQQQVTNFECDAEEPNEFMMNGNNNTRTVTEGSEEPVAAISFEHLKKDCQVLLNGVLHLAEPDNQNATAIIRIRRRDGFPLGTTGEVIYKTPPIQLDDATDQGYRAVPVLHCDDLCKKVCKKGKHDEVSYILTVEAQDDDVIVSPPRTFAGTVFNENNGHKKDC